MPVLSDEAILAALDAGQLEIEPFDVTNLTPNGYDLRIGEVALAGSEPISEGALSVPPQTRFAVSTLERVACGSALCGQLWLRSTWARRGVQASFGKVDAGFDGTLTLPGFNSAAEPLEVPVGETYCQLVLEALTSPASGSYSDRSGNYQHQRGVTW